MRVGDGGGGTVATGGDAMRSLDRMNRVGMWTGGWGVSVCVCLFGAAKVNDMDTRGVGGVVWWWIYAFVVQADKWNELDAPSCAAPPCAGNVLHILRMSIVGAEPSDNVSQNQIQWQRAQYNVCVLSAHRPGD